MNERDEILQRVRSALTSLPERTPLPQWELNQLTGTSQPNLADLAGAFEKRLIELNGLVFTDARTIAAFLREKGCRRGYRDPGLAEELLAPLAAEFALEAAFDRKRADDYEFGISRATGAIAATGTVVLTDQGSGSRLGGLAPWIHIAVVRRQDILLDIPAGIAALPKDPNVVWCTGPSRTADVEGILIRGVHAPGIQAAWIVG
ncbi:MAG TPA: LUD domain-containing protein [Opitutaceae bacterium]|jgi:L-lactate dehydrogenase complex protein LldG